MASVYILLILLCNILGCDAGDFCYQYLTYSYTYGQEYYSYYGYCDAGCCGYTVYRTCCQNKNNAGMIAGIVVGVLLFIGAIVIIVVCIYKNSKPIELPTDNEIEATPSECSDIVCKYVILLGHSVGEDGDEPFHPPPNSLGSSPPYDTMGQTNPAMTTEASVSPPPPYTDENRY
ncbi:uncharacterized protein LOC132558647 [Ylistrum balloti]|uniref:uncharacterized protein LOC132558647 n=1 Tax=Ylistrum balloti TaxID=509963 RepID=UPI002905DF26|nr:uncharacterized protein LOC132558647 [Ylistrum balloti]